MAKLPDIFKANAPIAHRLDMRLTFGKHRDLTIAEIIEIEPAYLLWAHRTVEWFRLADDVFISATKAHNRIKNDRHKEMKRDFRRAMRREMRELEYDYRDDDDNSRTVYFEDGSGYIDNGGPCGPLYFDKFGNT